MAKQQYPFELGRVVMATCGRDKGKFFVVIQVLADGYVLIADGKHRKMALPKRKKGKHLQAMPELFESISGKLIAKTKVFDSELASALRKYCEVVNGEPVGGN